MNAQEKAIYKRVFDRMKTLMDTDKNIPLDHHQGVMTHVVFEAHIDLLLLEKQGKASPVKDLEDVYRIANRDLKGMLAESLTAYDLLVQMEEVVDGFSLSKEEKDRYAAKSMDLVMRARAAEAMKTPEKTTEKSGRFFRQIADFTPHK